MYTDKFLMNEHQFSDFWGVSTVGNENTWLKGLNNNPNRMTRMSKDEEDGKVQVKLFVSDKHDTIRAIYINKNAPSPGCGLYVDGTPKSPQYDKNNVFWSKGDGTVPYDSAIWPYEQGWADLCSHISDKKHATLMKDFEEDVYEFLAGSPKSHANSLSRGRSESVGGKLALGITDSQRLLIVDEQNRRAGIDPDSGDLYQEIPGSTCSFNGLEGGVSIDNPAPGHYSVTYFGRLSRDFFLNMEFVDNGEEILVEKRRGFRPDAPTTFIMAFNMDREKPIDVVGISRPSDLQADPYFNNSDIFTGLSWSGVPGAAGYRVYATSESEPFYTRIAELGGADLAYHTDDPWCGDENAGLMSYAVTALHADGSESFFSDVVHNNDRDHDGLSDILENSFGTLMENSDTDGDLLLDGEEISFGTNPTIGDNDGDGYSDYTEINGWADPNDGEDIPDIPCIKKDIRDIQTADLEGFDAIMHLAGLSNDPLGDLKPNLTFEINHKASVRIAEIAKSVGVKRYIFSSSCSNYGASGDNMLSEESEFNPVTPYGNAKVMVEHDVSRLADSSFTPTFLRNATAYGVSPRLRFDLVLNNLVAWAYTTGLVYLKSDGTPWRPIVHIGDISRAFIAVLHAPREAVHNQAFNVGVNGDNYRIREIAEIVKETVPNCRIEYAADASPDKRCYRVDCSKLPRLLPEFEPQWDVRKGAQELYEEYKRTGLELGEFEGPRYQRLAHIKELLNSKQLDESLRWRNGN